MSRIAEATTLLREAQKLAAHFPSITDLMGGSLDNLHYQDLPIRRLPGVAKMLADRLDFSPLTAPLTKAVFQAAPRLHWQNTYTEAQVGADFLGRSCWFNLVSPAGPFLSQEVRVSIGYWGRGLRYPRHQHDPEEIYCMLAGRVRTLTDGRPPKEVGPGALIHHPPRIMHGFELPDAPLLAIAYWRGGNLLTSARLGE